MSDAPKPEPPDCGDNSCMFAEKKGGMRTNGGCRCYTVLTKPSERRYVRRLHTERVAAVNAHASLVAALKTPWLIKNVESHVYWAANGHGYTADVEAAGRYSTEEALIHVRARTVTATVGVVKPFEAPAEVMIPSPEFLAALEAAQKGGEPWLSVREGRRHRA